MLDLPIRNIYLARELVDMRKSYDTLSDHIRFHLKKDPLSGDAFVFIGKSRNRLKILFWEESGFWLCCKRLEKGTFSKLLMESLCNDELDSKISSSQWHNLLEGIIVVSSRRLKRYKKIK